MDHFTTLFLGRNMNVTRVWAVLALSTLMICVNSLQSSNHILKATDLQYGKFRDCHERWEAGERIPGVYNIFLNGSHPIKIYCNHSVGYTYSVIQRRYYGNVAFNRNWQQYQAGFGDLQGDHWLGLDSISLLTSGGAVNLQVDLEDWAGVKHTVYLHSFQVAPAASFYRMTFSAYTGSLVNDFAPNNGMYFYTSDRPDQANCAFHQKSGWWFNPGSQCTYFLPNGVYYTGGPYKPVGQYYDGIYYRDWHGFQYSLKYITLSIYKKTGYDTGT